MLCKVRQLRAQLTERTLLARLRLDFVLRLFLQQSALVLEYFGLGLKFDIALREQLILRGKFHNIRATLFHLLVVLVYHGIVCLDIVSVLPYRAIEIYDAVNGLVGLEVYGQYFCGHVGHVGCLLYFYKFDFKRITLFGGNFHNYKTACQLVDVYWPR